MNVPTNTPNAPNAPTDLTAGTDVAPVDDARSLELADRHDGNGVHVPKDPRRLPRQPLGLRPSTWVYTLSNLIFWSIFGTLARLGIQGLTTYDGAPLSFASAWFNFAGCFCMGFLWEDRVVMFGHAGTEDPITDRISWRQARDKVKKTVPLFVGLSTGFCGSFTSFSALMRDMFISMSGDLNTAMHDQSHGQAFMSLMAVLITGLALSFAGCYLGRHLALSIEEFLVTRKPFLLPHTVFNIGSPALAAGAWIASICLAALMSQSWPGHRVVVALSFAPLGCLLRYGLSLTLNNRWLNLKPAGTLSANVLGTAIFAAAWISVHLDHTAGYNTHLGCVLLAGGIQDGFCGCLTTVSTFVIEIMMASKEARHKAGYIYGALSVALAWGTMVVIVGPVRWGSSRFVEPLC